MSNQSKIVDLEMGADGAYTPKNVKAQKPCEPVHKKQEMKHVTNQADEFLSGLDEGLDFVENISRRVDRMFKLRG